MTLQVIYTQIDTFQSTKVVVVALSEQIWNTPATFIAKVKNIYEIVHFPQSLVRFRAPWLQLMSINSHDAKSEMVNKLAPSQKHKHRTSV